MTAPAFVPCKCTHGRAAHLGHGVEPQCLAPGCSCLSYRPDAERAGRPVEPARPVPIRGEALRAPAAAPPMPTTNPGERPISTDGWLKLGKQSKLNRTRQLTEKIAVLIADLRGRLVDEQRAGEHDRAKEQERAVARARIAQLETELRAARAVLNGKKPPAAQSATASPPPVGQFECTRTGCIRLFATSQARAMHERRAHDGFDPKAVAS